MTTGSGLSVMLTEIAAGTGALTVVDCPLVALVAPVALNVLSAASVPVPLGVTTAVLLTTVLVNAPNSHVMVSASLIVQPVSGVMPVIGPVKSTVKVASLTAPPVLLLLKVYVTEPSVEIGSADSPEVSTKFGEDGVHGANVVALLRGVRAVATVKSAELLSVSVHPLELRIAAVETLRVVTAVPSASIVPVPYPTKSTISGSLEPLSKVVVLLTKATEPLPEAKFKPAVWSAAVGIAGLLDPAVPL